MFDGIYRLFDLATNSLTKKIIWLTCLSVFLSTFLISAINYFRIEDIVLNAATEKLAGQTRLIAQRFMASYDQLESDAQVLSLTPPIQGIIRSTINGGVDPLDGSSTDLWRTRLSKIFSSVMVARPHYFQIRFIGIADNGREIVRVNRVPFGLELVPIEELQEKESEPYFQNILQAGNYEVQFTDVSFNRERGKIDPGLVPTMRAIIPIYDLKNKIYGMIVINSKYDDMLSTNFSNIKPDHDTTVFNNNGDHITYERNGKLGRFIFRGTDNLELNDSISHIFSSNKPEQIIFDSDTIYYSVIRYIDPDNTGAFLGVILQIPYDELLGPALRARTINVYLGISLLVLCLILSLFLSRKFTKPLIKMADDIKSAGSRHHLPGLPIDRNDEFGDLARAFDKKARELAVSEEKIRSVLDNIVDGIITIDELGRIDSYNPSCERIFGYTAEEVIGKNVGVLMPEPYTSEHNNYLSQYLKSGTLRIIGETRELSARRKDGSVFPMEISISELRSNNQRLFSGIIRDISERKQIEIMKDEFISTVNHEIRTPLTAIQGSLGLLKHRTAGTLDIKAAKLLNLSYENCENLAHLINDILDIEKMAAGKTEYNIEDADICAVVAQTVDQQFAYAEKYGVKFVLHSDVDQVIVRIDRNRFNQALVNLLSNAAKFSPRDAQVEVTVSVPDDRLVRVSVKDYGPGIPVEFHGKIFEKFAQADSSATRAKGGSGLGLSITKTIIEALDGTVDFETEDGKGTTFTFVLPVSSAATDAEAVENQAVA